MAVSTDERDVRSSSVNDCSLSQLAKAPLHLYRQSTTSCFGCACAACGSECVEGDAIATAKYSVGGQAKKTFTICQVQRHCTPESAWLVAGDSIFDATEYMSQHPGGVDSILRKAGGVVDCTSDLQFHSRSGRKVWQKYLVGKLVPCSASQGPSADRRWWQLW